MAPSASTEGKAIAGGVFVIGTPMSNTFSAAIYNDGQSQP
jgi:hypothetical protein